MITSETWELLNQKNELTRLKKWAFQKGYEKPFYLYRDRLEDTERVIIRLRTYSKKATNWAYIIFWFSNLITTAPRYPKKGIAAYYKIKNYTFR